MKKIILSVIMLSMCTFISAQNILNVSGVITDIDGNGAGEIFLSLDFENPQIEDQFTETDGDGAYDIQIVLDDTTEECFELYFVDCNYEIVSEAGCYNLNNTDFDIDFVFCENGISDCQILLFPILDGSTITLNVIPFGTSPFTYLWEDGSAEETLTIAAGNAGYHCVTVTDDEDCVVIECIDLTPPDPCFVNIFEEIGYNETVLYAEGYGQSSNLSYLWSSGETSPAISVTESGEYCVTLSDDQGCQSFDCKTIEIDTTGIEDCFAFIYSIIDSDGIETLNVDPFGVSPYSYEWTLGNAVVSTSDSFVPTEDGYYCVLVTDSAGCISSDCYDFLFWEDCSVWVISEPIANGGLLWACGYGSEPIEYLWNNGATGDELIATEEGEYCVTITDSEGCTSSACTNVVIEDAVECYMPIEVDEYANYAQLTINPVTGGEYNFYWNTGEMSSSITVQSSGIYCVDVYEVTTGCYYTTCVSIDLGDEDNCWGYILPIFNGDSSIVLSVIENNINPVVLTYEYSWSTGEESETVEVSQDGYYCVTVLDSEDCEFEACLDVSYWGSSWENMIFGLVTDLVTGEPLDALVDIYSVHNDGSLGLYAEEVPAIEGMYTVNNVPNGEYIVLAFAEDQGYVPTYGTNTSSWVEADQHSINNNITLIPVPISMIPLTSIESGVGSISGSVWSGYFGEGIAIEGANIMLIQFDAHIGQLFTNEIGEFNFTELPYGTYYVVLEIPGLPREVIEVTISEEISDVINVDFETDFAVTSTDYLSSLSSLTLSPNPTTHTLLVEADLETRTDLNLRVIDMNGKIIKSSVFNAEEGENMLQLDVSSLKNGVYNLVLQSNEELVAKRFIKL